MVDINRRQKEEEEVIDSDDSLVGMAGQYQAPAPATPTHDRGGYTVTGPAASPTGTKSSTVRITPSIPEPTYGEMPNLIIPEIDEGRVSELTRKISSPYVRNLRRSTNVALRRHYDNPNVAKMVTRSALQGFGQSLASVMGGAGTQARAEAREELQPKVTAALTQYSAEINRKNAVYEAAWNNYLNSIGSKTTSQYTYGDEEEEQEPKIIRGLA